MYVAEPLTDCNIMESTQMEFEKTNFVDSPTYLALKLRLMLIYVKSVLDILNHLSILASKLCLRARFAPEVFAPAAQRHGLLSLHH